MQKLSKLSDLVAKYLLAGILIIVPLFPKFPFIRIPGTYVSIRLEDTLLLMLGLVTLFKIIPNLRDFLKNKIVLSILTFFLIGLVSVLAGAFITQTISISLGLLHLIRRMEYIVPFFAVLYLIPKDKVGEYLSFFVKVLTIVVLVAFVYGFGQRYFNFPIIVTQNEEYSKGVALFWTAGSHINSTFAGHYDLAAFIVLILPVFILGIFSFKDTFTKVYLSMVSGAGLWLLISSVSRIAQASYFIALSLTFILSRKMKPLIAVLVISVVLAMFSPDLRARFTRVIEVFSQKIGIEKIVSYNFKSFTVMAEENVLPEKREDAPIPTPTPVPVFEDRSTSIRLAVEWPRAIRAFEKNPLLGTGYSSITLATDNDYLRLLGETGILGFLSFWLIFFNIGKVLIKALPLSKNFDGIEKIYIAGLLGSMIGMFALAFFIDIFEASKFAIIYWLLVGMAVKLVQSKEYVK